MLVFLKVSPAHWKIGPTYKALDSLVHYRLAREPMDDVLQLGRGVVYSCLLIFQRGHETSTFHDRGRLNFLSYIA